MGLARTRARKLALWIGGAVAAYAVLGFLVAPPIVRHQLEQALSEQLGRRTSIEAVRINPFALSASVRGLNIREREGDASMAGFESLDMDVALSSLLRRGIIVEALHLEKPHARAVRFADGTYSFQDIADKLARPAPGPSGPPPRFAVYNITVSGGRIEFDDRPEKTLHTVTDLRIGVPFVSSLPAEIDIVVAPHLSAKVNGNSFEVAGETKPFKDTHETTLRIDIDDLQLGKYLEYVPVPLHVRVPSGALTTRLVVSSIVHRGGKLETLVLSGRAEVQRLAVQQADGGPLIAIARTSVELEAVDILKRRVAIKTVRIEAPELDVVRQKDGSLNLVAAFPPAPAEAQAKPAPKPDEPTLALTIGDVALLGGQVRFVDRTPDKPVRVALNDVSMLVEGLSSAPESRADLKLTARINRAAPVEIAGKVNLLSASPFADLTASARDIDLRPMSPYSVMHAGHAIAQGRLTLKQAVKLADRKLGSENAIRLDQFEFGERVDSPTATTLPVTVALAALKDRNGVIEVSLPISASLDDPQAGGGEAIRREAGGFIGRAATQPFTLLGGEELAYLEFTPGSASLDAGAEAKLKTLAQALYDRPGLKLDVRGRAEPDTDGAELKRGTKGPVSEQDLRLLATLRAQATKDWLVASGKLAEARVAIVAPAMDAQAPATKGRMKGADFVLR